MTKVHGKRYAYKFDFHGLMAACQAQAQGQGSDVMSGYGKYHAGAQGDMSLYTGATGPGGKLPHLLPPTHATGHPAATAQPAAIFPTSAYWYSGGFDHRGGGGFN